MSWTDDKEAEHQRIRADFAEAEVERLRVEAQILVNDGAKLLDENERLRAALAKEHGVDDGVSHERDAEFPDEVCDLLFGRAIHDVPRVTDAERAEAQRVRNRVVKS